MKIFPYALAFLAVVSGCKQADIAIIHMPLFEENQSQVNIALGGGYWQWQSDNSGSVWMQADVTSGVDVMHLGMGNPLTHLRWQGMLPEPMLDGENYRIDIRVKKVQGNDFALGVTFPIGDQYATAVFGGWGGVVCGLSCVNGLDASENPNHVLEYLPIGAWQDIILEVRPQAIVCILNEQVLWQQPREGMQFDLHYAMEEQVPFGLSAFSTESAIASISVSEILDD